MSCGLVLTVIAFLISALLEHQMNLSSIRQNPTNQVKLINTSPCRFNISLADNEMSIINQPFAVLESNYLNNNAQILSVDFINDMALNSTSTFKIRGFCKLQNTSLINIDQNLVLSNSTLPKNVIIYLNKFDGTINTLDFAYDLKK